MPVYKRIRWRKGRAEEVKDEAGKMKKTKKTKKRKTRKKKRQKKRKKKRQKKRKKKRKKKEKKKKKARRKIRTTDQGRVKPPETAVNARMTSLKQCRTHRATGPDTFILRRWQLLNRCDDIMPASSPVS